MISQSPPFNNFNIANNNINNFNITNNNNNNNNINNKCVYHTNNDITFLCSDCNLIPCCNSCISQNNFHRGHKIDLIDDSTICSLINNFKEEIYPNILKLLKNDEITNNESIEKFEKIKIEYQHNIETISNHFKNIHQIISLIENEIKNNLSITFNNNVDLNSNISNLINDNNDSLQSIIYNNKTIERINNFNVDFDDENQTLELIKHYQQSLKLLNYNCNNNINKQLIEYKNHFLSFNKNKLEKVQLYIESIKEFDLKKKKK
ncbi:hypothetical protein ACTFIY_001167 [Dictyostelium cf. discoideum]